MCSRENALKMIPAAVFHMEILCVSGPEDVGDTLSVQFMPSSYFSGLQMVVEHAESFILY